MASYKDQLDRTLRYLLRIETHDRPPVEYDDDIWSFFQNCWHLKDWVANDTAIPEATRQGIATAVYSSRPLLVCADLANATKHLQLTRPQVGARHSHKNYRIVVGYSSSVEYFIDTGDGNRCDGLQLARDCINEWQTILAAHGLPP